MPVEAVGEEEHEGLPSVADQLIERGRKEGAREMLLTLLGARFGELPDDVLRRVKTADVAQIELWAERLLSAPTLADVLGESRG